MVAGMMDETYGSQADETIHFGLDGAEFELNLSKAHAEELRGTLQPYIKVARRIGGKRNGRRRAPLKPTIIRRTRSATGQETRHEDIG
jgi:Lsr2